MARAEAEVSAQSAQAILDQLRRVVLGQEAALRDSVAALIARGHVLLEGVPGTAKTLLVRTLGLALGLEFRRIQFTPDLMPSDITGVNLLSPQGGASPSGRGRSSATWCWATRSTARRRRPRPRCSRRCRSGE